MLATTMAQAAAIKRIKPRGASSVGSSARLVLRVMLGPDSFGVRRAAPYVRCEEEPL